VILGTTSIEDVLPELRQFGVLAKPPLLGPIVGWTRREHGRLLARVWIRLDDTDSDAPVAALTVRMRDGKVEPGSAQVWAAFKLERGVRELAEMGCVALADLPFADGDDVTYRMVGLHFLYQQAAGASAEDGDRPMQIPAANDVLPSPSQRAAKALHDKISKPNPSLISPGQRREDGEQTAESIAEPRAPEGYFEALFPGRSVRELEQLGQTLITELEHRIAEATTLADRPIPGTLSRKRLQRADTRDCEIRLAPSARAHSAATPPRIARFVATSCRYPGITFDIARADRTVDSISSLADSATEGPAFVLMLGDQIYADATAGLFDVTSRLEKFNTRYVDAFGARGLRRLMARVPTYMVPDDHEIEDGWPASMLRPGAGSYAARRADAMLFHFARATCLGHQRAHGPRAMEVAGDAARYVAPLWYALPPEFPGASARGERAREPEPVLPMFAMDTRFERAPGPASELRRGTRGRTDPRYRLMNDRQWRALETWLASVREAEESGALPRHVPKLLASGSVFAPGLEEFARHPAHARRADGWQAFPEARAHLLDLVVASGLQNILFIAGDYHCAAVARLEFAARPELRAYAIVAPPLYAPLPFVNATPFEITAEETIPGVAAGPVTVRDAQAFTLDAGFALVSVERIGTAGVPDDWQVRVDFHAPASVAGAAEGAPATRTVWLANGSVSVVRG
jgi:hypothetical protein